MKHRNKGHEFDELGKFFKENSKIFLVGTERSNAACADDMHFLGVPFTQLRRGRIDRQQFSGGIVVLSEKGLKGNIALRNFINKGFIQNRNVFQFDDFIQRYASVYLLYITGEVLFYNTCLITTTICNLNCKYCLNYTPFLKEKTMKHNSLEELKKEVDLLLSCVDKVRNFALSGGEPLLHPQIGDLLKYINDNYRDKILILSTITNGTVIPTDEVCSIIKQSDTTIYCDNYVTLPGLREKYSETYYKCIDKYKQHGIRYKENKVFGFLKMFPDSSCVDNEDSLIKKFDNCGRPTIRIHYGSSKNGRVYVCNYNSFAETAGLITVEEDEYYDLNTFDGSEQSKKELIEYKLGFNSKGYMEWCKYCTGFDADLDDGVEQAEGRMTWDKSNPGVVGGSASSKAYRKTLRLRTNIMLRKIKRESLNFINKANGGK